MSTGPTLVYWSSLTVGGSSEKRSLYTVNKSQKLVCCTVRVTHRVGFGEHSENVLSFTDSILNPFWFQKV